MIHNGDRHNGYGPKLGTLSRNLSAAMGHTRRVVEAQPPGAGFPSTPPTADWTCACGMRNPTRRDRCRWCGEPLDPVAAPDGRVLNTVGPAGDAAFAAQVMRPNGQRVDGIERVHDRDQVRIGGRHPAADQPVAQPSQPAQRRTEPGVQGEPLGRGEAQHARTLPREASVVDGARMEIRSTSNKRRPPTQQSTIHPTHTCFDDALEGLEQMAKEKPSILRGADLLVVHAVCMAPDGHEYSHAWLELAPAKGVGCGDDVAGVVVIFRGILDGTAQYFAVDRSEYYRETRVQQTTKYTPRQAWEMNRRFLNYGPWEERYQRLCRERKDRCRSS